MPTDPRKRQKKLERRAAKRKSKHHVLVKEKNAGLPQRMADAASYPIVDCGVSDSLWDMGMGSVWLSRQLPNGSIAVAIFLLDRYCLGVKNALADITGRFTYESKYMNDLRGRGRKMAPEAARKLVESAVEYARRLGFAPHADYHKARPIFGDIDASTCTEEFEFGKDGKPFFIAGPHDSPQRCREIMNTLRMSCGPGGSHFLIPVNPNEHLRQAFQDKRTELLEPGEEDMTESEDGPEDEHDLPL
jgi:hypothetical protein